MQQWERVADMASARSGCSAAIFQVIFFFFITRQPRVE